ncbi:MurR/RpiR family transcriptional regulator [Peptacetobacter hiranonis]|uniref:Transcriptional regulator, RpiR family n=1 Tax=Peptacetobacter hiranonis (strain DSM 13275 / JCM 10541 / KCTC 15199 / TO-931) TaxID=500633 RepID=B6FWE5_PEPHT|nr:MurR/RpiR family transcriptional regulator [Peptacetobacter hiranonis]EEA86162.1 transcriptional regulator, RpiR family [Peptacetobacter hiranonis DSM 13275]QEK21254.1 putative HTH-type transcriptional regulator YbbH [Peptacetobacter hiranonis]
MSILKQLEEPNFKATKSDKVLIEYIKENIEDVFYKSISQIAKESGIGEATITRFSKKMGYSGLQDFKVTLAREISGLKNRKIINRSIENDEGVMESARKLFNSNIRILENTFNIIDGNDIEKATDMIINAKKVFFIGIGYSGMTAEDSNYKFSRIGFNCMSLDSSHNMIMMASLMDEDDVIVAISHSGETDEIIKTVNIAKANGASVISVTEDKSSRLRDISDVNLGYFSGESILETGSISSKLAQFFIIDLVYTQVVKEKSAEVVERKIKTTDAIKLYNE